MSLSGTYSQALNDAVTLAAEKILFSLAAGNQSIDANSRSPASANGNNIYTVSAIDSGDGFAYFSNYGSSVDYAAPGVNVLSTYKGGGYATMSGTSMAAPHMAGILLAGEGSSTCSNASGDPDGNPDPIAELGVCSASAPSN
jgi:subtilisin family serine protease